MAKLYGLSRGAIYDKVAKGNLTATLNERGQKVVDIVDMITLYGEAPIKTTPIEQQKTVQNSSKKTELDNIELYKKMLEISESARLKAENREERLFNEISQLKNEISELKNILGYTEKNNIKQQKTVQNSLAEQSYSTNLNSDKQDNIRVSPTKKNVGSDFTEEKTKRGFWSRFFLPNG